MGSLNLVAARLLAARFVGCQAAGCNAAGCKAAGGRLQARPVARLFFKRFPFEPALPKLLIKPV